MRMLFLLLALAACRAPAPRPEEKANWSGQMQGMATDVKKLIPYLYDRQAFADPKNREKISQTLKEFSQAAHKVNPESGRNFIGDELLLEYSLANLREELGRAAQSFDAGQLDYARSVAKTLAEQLLPLPLGDECWASAAWDLDQIHNLSLAPLEKADLLVATRKYDQASAYMEGQLSSPDFYKMNGMDFEGLLRRYLAVLIRVEKDPARALTALNKVLDRGDTPHFVLEQAEGWRKSLSDWRREKPPRIRDAAGLFAQVEKRLTKANALQSYEKDHAGDVEYLRATALLHNGIELAKTPAEQARALYLLGKSYEVLDELGAWNLHENYYEACVIRDPKSAMAKRCFNRLEASLYLGYSGSAGVNLPGDERARLDRLRAMVQ
jgi:hypothetical protein